jgi:hypothetical protein
LEPPEDALECAAPVPGVGRAPWSRTAPAWPCMASSGSPWARLLLASPGLPGIFPGGGEPRRLDPHHRPPSSPSCHRRWPGSAPPEPASAPGGRRSSEGRSPRSYRFVKRTRPMVGLKEKFGPPGSCSTRVSAARSCGPARGLAARAVFFSSGYQFIYFRIFKLT